MTEKEYRENADRVKEYAHYKSLLQRLEKEQSEIDSGVLEITTFYQRKIDCYGREEFVTRLKETLLDFYAVEIKRIIEQIESI